MNKYSRGLIALQTYSRPEILRQCLLSIAQATESSKIRKIILLQTGNELVEELVEQFAAQDSLTSIIRVDGSGKTPLQNMNQNRWLLWQIGFDELRCDWMLTVEEDVVLHPDIFRFVQAVTMKYENDKKFRGVNLGSKLQEAGLAGTYSLLRYGCHGCCGVISRRTWELFKRLGVQRTLRYFPLDSSIEGIMKTGYVVTPNLSYYLDFGWFQGTHTGSDKNNPHYLAVESSFKCNSPMTRNDYAEKSIDHDWRIDCRVYNPKNDFWYFINMFRGLVANTLTARRAFKLLRNTKRFFLGRQLI